MTGWNMPQGVNVSDIPGNRPEDIEYETIMTEFYTSLTEKETNLVDSLVGQGTKLTARDLDVLIWKAIELGRRIDNQKDQPEDYEDFIKPSEAVCCCCAESEKNYVPEPKVLYRCSKPGCECYTCEEHRGSCGYCLGCCVEDHEFSNHSKKD
jgi:hypothetical protein